MPRMTTFLTACGAGCTLMYWLDPALGRRRRAHARNRAVHAVRSTQIFVDRGIRDLRHRTVGAVYGAQSVFRRGTADDRTLQERVRAKIGRFASHPGALDVTAHDGHVTLTGPVLAHEADGIVKAAGSVPGIFRVSDQLERHEDPRGVSSLQQGGRLQGEPLAVPQRNWPPGMRLLATGIGAGLMLNCLARRTPGAITLGTVGFGLFLRGATNLSPRQLAGVRPDGHAVTVRRTFHIAAPLERVFDFMTDWEQSALFMPHIKHVEQVAEQRLRWTYEVAGVKELELEEDVIELRRPEFVAWRSTPESPIAYEKQAKFEIDGESHTRVDVQVAYTPPAGAVGHAAASFAGYDPKTQLEETFQRIKTFLETGKRPHDVEEKLQQSRR